MNENFENYNGGESVEGQGGANYNPISSEVNGDMSQQQSSLNVVSLVLGIIALLGSCCLSFITLPFSIAGLICGLKYKKRMKKGCPGIVINIIAIVLAVLMTIFTIFMIVTTMMPLMNSVNEVSEQAIMNIGELNSLLEETKVPENAEINGPDDLQSYINAMENLENEISKVSGVDVKDEPDNSSSLQNYMSSLENFDEEDKKELKNALDSLDEEDKKELKNALNNMDQEDKEELKNVLNNLDEEDKEELKKFAEAFKNGNSDISMEDLDTYMTILKGLKSAN